MKPTYSLSVLFFLLLSVLPSPAQKSTHNFEVAKNLDIFNALYRELDLYYVDTLDAKKNIDNALAYMLEMLDPYTEYYPEEETSSLQELTTGKYAGIGTQIGYSEAHHRCIISKPYAGMPAAQAGLLPGDIILAIDGEDIQPLENPTEERIADYTEQVSGKLRGEAGITLELKIRRPEQNKVFTYKLVRRNILMPSVSLAAMVTDSIGYICLTQFIEGTSNEIRRALVELKQQGARSLILDLRDNPGGVMEEAVKTVNLFIPRGREVVSTRGKVKELNAVYKTQIDPQDPDIPLIILTNEHSASAAEITSGALQDYDRALIMGRRTYGKGLVQQSRELPYKALLKLTTAKYYIPSGRCVQAYEFRDGVPLHLPDSLSREFRTAAGRPVRGGGGVKPDVEIPADSLPNLLTYLANSTQLFDYCVRYRARHPHIAKPTEFRLTAEEYADFCLYMKQNNFSYDRQSLRLLETLRRMAAFEGYATEAQAELDALEKKLQHNADYDFQRWEPEIRRMVEAAIIENYYYDAGSEEYLLQTDKVVQQAIEMMHNRKLMHKLLSGEPDA
ncbi:MAG: S41 family peptidase [Alloprevotella sp.]|nr:S41 family peptidase [Alloprevotella sp.]